MARCADTQRGCIVKLNASHLLILSTLLEAASSLAISRPPSVIAACRSDSSSCELLRSSSMLYTCRPQEEQSSVMETCNSCGPAIAEQAQQGSQQLWMPVAKDSPRMEA